MYKPKIISLFTGAGGLDLGFEAAGGRIVFSCDILKEACMTLRHNFPSSFIFGPPDYTGDVKELTKDFILERTKSKIEDVDIVIGGPPCQPFSVAASQRFLKKDERFKRRGYECEVRGDLIFEFIRLIIGLKPKVFLMENVPGILTIDNGETVKNIKNALENSGYNINSPILIEAKNYGVPQTRNRIFIIGSIFKNHFKTPPVTHGKTESLFLKKYRNVAQALYKFNYNLLNSETRNHKPESLNRYKKLSYGQREKLGRVDRLAPNIPSKTVIAGGNKGGGRSHLHPYLARTLSPRECARFQTFPDNFEFFGTTRTHFQQVGNAVPPLLAEVLAREIMKQYFGISSKRKKYKFDVQDIDSDLAETELLNSSREQAKHLLYEDLD